MRWCSPWAVSIEAAIVEVYSAQLLRNFLSPTASPANETGRRHLFSAYIIAALSATTYALTPDNNTYIYFFVKKNIWILVGSLVWAVESFDNCIPDVSEWTYIAAYIVGYAIPLLLFGLPVVIGKTNDSNADNVVIIFSLKSQRPLYTS